MGEDAGDPDSPDNPGSPNIPEGEEPSAGVLSPSDELEAALREASESLESRTGGAPGASPATSADKVTIEALSDELRSLTETHSTVLAELEETKDKFLRLQAEFENFRRRNMKERQEALQYGHQNLVKDLLPTVDNLERAVVHAEGSQDGDLENLLQGVDLVLKELLGVLARYEVTRIESEGQVFDPAVHEAIAQAPDDSVPPNSIVNVLQQGYLLRDRMLRPARVVVSKAPDETDPPGGES